MGISLGDHVFLVFQLVEPKQKLNLIIKLLLRLVAHEANILLEDLTVLDHVDVSDAVLEDVQVLGVGTDLTECAVVESLVLEIFHTNGEQVLIRLLLLVVEKDALPFFHLSNPTFLLGALPGGGVLVENVENSVDRLGGLPHLRNHQEWTLRLIKTQLQLVMLCPSKHTARDLDSLDGSQEGSNISRCELALKLYLNGEDLVQALDVNLNQLVAVSDQLKFGPRVLR